MKWVTIQAGAVLVASAQAFFSGIHKISRENALYMSPQPAPKKYPIVNSEKLQQQRVAFNQSDNRPQNNTIPEDQMRVRVFLSRANLLRSLGIELDDDTEDALGEDSPPQEDFFPESPFSRGRRLESPPPSSSKNFQVIRQFDTTFADVGGYDLVKEELRQCLDILVSYQKYQDYNVRVPKGLIMEGPPGTGKTMLAKALAGEAQCAFIAVSGADFQEKYVGVGSSRVKELFDLARKNVPCVIFIDEIDAVGKRRSSDGEGSSNERDNTLNSLLVELDGFKNTTGVFLVAATNRADLLDPALTRPGRIDKRIFIGLPDRATRKAILSIHLKGKPRDRTILIDDLVDQTEGYSGAQIENLLNEAMLYALRNNFTQFNRDDLDAVFNKVVAGWQPMEHEFSAEMLDRIAVHEIGHAAMGTLSRHHPKVTKVSINLFSPTSPGYTQFEGGTNSMFTKESLTEHIMILLSGRIAEEIFYGESVTTGAINDFEESHRLAEKMVASYGMGEQTIYPKGSEKYRQHMDEDIGQIIDAAYLAAKGLLLPLKSQMRKLATELLEVRTLTADRVAEIIAHRR